MKVYFIKPSVIFNLIKLAVLALIVLFIAFQMDLIPSKYKAMISSDARAIKKVMQQTDEIFVSRPNSEDREEVKRYLKNTIENLKKIDTTNCPYDFRIAFEKLSKAYEELYSQMQSDPDLFFSRFFAEPLSEEHKKLFAPVNEAEDEINRIEMQLDLK